MVKRRSNSFLPDEIVIDIVSRLPAKDVIRYRHVCRSWRDLTSTRQFVDLHRQHQGIVPLILVENCKNIGVEHFLLDKWWKPARTKSEIQKNPIYNEYRVQLSHDGLIVFKQGPTSRNFIILNPINGENIQFCLSVGMEKSDIYGVFFHPSLKEYCTLWLTMPPDYLTTRTAQYRLLSMGPNPCWRNIKSPVGHKARMGYTKSSFFLRNTRPIFVDKYIYWMVLSEEHLYYHSKIMEFDINIEELTLMTPPVPPVQCSIFDKKLMNIAGVLSMVEIYPSAQLIIVDIWTLRSRSEQLWTKSSFRINNEIYKPTPRTITIFPIAVVDGELVFLSDERVFACSLRAGTIRKFGRKFNHFADVFLSRYDRCFSKKLQV